MDREKIENRCAVDIIKILKQGEFDTVEYKLGFNKETIETVVAFQIPGAASSLSGLIPCPLYGERKNGY